MTVQQFWEEYCHLAGLDPLTPYQAWYFGNSTDMASELVALVVAGKKTATASLVETNRREPQNAPVDGGYSVVTDLEGDPKCIIQTVQIRDLPFDEVDAQFAFEEGEGDRTLEAWRDVHWQYFAREAAEKGFTFDEGSMVCCERFKLLYS